MTTRTKACIRIEHLKFSYGRGRFTLGIEDLLVGEDRAIALVGQSGAGKTTLLCLMAGILTPDEGRVHLFDTCLSELGEGARRRLRIQNFGLVFQEFELLEHLTVGENILLPYHINDALRLDGSVRDRARELARRAGLGAFLSRRPRELSQGERQRVAVLRALITRPPVVLADEPTGNLDQRTSAEILDLMEEEVRGRKGTLVTVTHDPSVLSRFDEVVDMRELQA